MKVLGGGHRESFFVPGFWPFFIRPSQVTCPLPAAFQAFLTHQLTVAAHLRGPAAGLAEALPLITGRWRSSLRRSRRAPLALSRVVVAGVGRLAGWRTQDDTHQKWFPKRRGPKSTQGHKREVAAICSGLAHSVPASFHDEERACGFFPCCFLFAFFLTSEFAV